MNVQQARAEDARGTYEIHLNGSPPEPILARFPGIEVAKTPAQTVLTRQIDRCAELDALLDQLLSMGLILTEVHETTERPSVSDGADLGRVGQP